MGRFLLERWHGMAVGVQGDGDIRVTESLLHHLRVDTGGQCQSRVGVPEIVQADDWYSGVEHVATERSSYLSRVKRPAILSGEHQAGVGPGRAPRESLGRLVLTPSLESCDGSRVERHRPAALRCLGFAHEDLVADRDQRSAHRDPGPAEVDVRPLDAEELPRRIPVELASSQRA
jgi:hypothetical protein